MSITNDFDNQAAFETRINLAFKHQANTLKGSVVACSLIALTVWDNGLPIYGWCWLIGVTFVIAARAVVFWAYFSERYCRKYSLKGWTRIILAFQILVGILWAFIPILFFDYNSLVNITVLSLMTFTGAIGSIPVLLWHPPFWHVSVLPMMITMPLTHFLSNVEESYLIGVVTLITFTGIVLTSRTGQKQNREMIFLQQEQKRLLEELRAEKEISDQATISKSKFLAAASHDLRQPVQSFTLIIEVLQLQQLPDTAKQLVEKLAVSVNSLRSLFNSLLDISSLDAGTIEVNNMHFDIAELCDELHDSFLNQAQEKKLTFKKEIIHSNIYSDRILVKRILSNLITNALLYTDKGSVTIKTELVNKQLSVSVIDTGKGIAQSEVDKIFDEFHQLNNPERDRNKGLGLGLAICRRLSNLLNTSIKVESELGEGTTFAFKLPISEVEFVSYGNEMETNLEKGLSGKILVIDDEQEILEVMPPLLTEWGINEVEMAGSHQQAVTIIERGFLPDMIISDYRLQENQTGIETIQTIRKTYKQDIPALLITGDTGPESLAKISAANIPVLHKPILPEKLKQTLANMMSN